jgi:DNA-directed RNA polymerase specialized sigma24 family protein
MTVRSRVSSKELLRERLMADDAIRDVLERSIVELPDELRTVFVACDVDGMTPEHCAELFALTLETVEARLHNARSLLGEVLIGRFGPPFGGVYQFDDSRSERITNAVMHRLFAQG